MIQGSCDPAFEAVRAEFARGFGELADDPERGEVGASVAVRVAGRSVVDLWAGHTDAERQSPWQRDTLASLFSTTKGVTAILAHRLVDRGLLDLEAPVAHYWPEFSAAGKEHVPVHTLLSHRSGSAAVRERIGPFDLYDWGRMTDALAAEDPWWKPGERHGYHAFSFGWLVGELIRRITGLTPGRLLCEDLAEPLGLDLHIGLESAEHARVADLTPLPPPGPGSDQAQLLDRILSAPDSVSARAFANPPTLLAPGEVNTARWRRAEIPAANAHGTARALAKLYGGLSAGPTALLSPESLERCEQERSSGFDEVLRIPTRFSLGFMLSQPSCRFGPGAKAFGHPGAGGSLGLADPEAEVGFGYVMNRTGPHVLLDPRPAALLDALYGCL